MQTREAKKQEDAQRKGSRWGTRGGNGKGGQKKESNVGVLERDEGEKVRKGE